MQLNIGKLLELDWDFWLSNNEYRAKYKNYVYSIKIVSSENCYELRIYHKSDYIAKYNSLDYPEIQKLWEIVKAKYNTEIELAVDVFESEFMIN